MPFFDPLKPPLPPFLRVSKVLVFGCPLNPLKRLLYLLNRIPQHHRPSVRAAHGALRLCQLLQQPFHLVLLQRHVDLDGRMARDAGRDLPSDLVQVQYLLFLLKLV